MNSENSKARLLYFYCLLQRIWISDFILCLVMRGLAKLTKTITRELQEKKLRGPLQNTFQ